MEDNFEIDPEEFDRLMEHYIEIGAIAVNGINHDGSFIYVVTEDAKEIAPELWEVHHEMIDEALLDLFDKGLIDIEYDEDLNVKMKVSADAKEMMYELGYVDMDVLEDEKEEDNE